MHRHYYKVLKMILNAIDLAYDMVIIRYLQNIIEFWKHCWYVVERMKIVYQMDHTAARKRPSSAKFHEYLSYLAHQDGYQRFRATSGAQVSRRSA
jgi:hypothetical protein